MHSNHRLYCDSIRSIQKPTERCPNRAIVTTKDGDNLCGKHNKESVLLFAEMNPFHKDGETYKEEDEEKDVRADDDKVQSRMDMRMAALRSSTVSEKVKRKLLKAIEASSSSSSSLEFSSSSSSSSSKGKSDIKGSNNIDKQTTGDYEQDTGTENYSSTRKKRNSTSSSTRKKLSVEKEKASIYTGLKTGSDEMSPSACKNSNNTSKIPDDYPGMKLIKESIRRSAGRTHPSGIPDIPAAITCKYSMQEVQGKRDYMQDRLLVKTLKCSSPYLPGLSVLAMVCDGHGGDEDGHLCADYCIDNFPSLLQRFLNAKDRRTGLYKYDAKTALYCASLQMNDDWEKHAYSHTPTLEAGTTFLVTLLHIGSGVMWTANIGDSRAIWIRKKKVLYHTDDHKPTHKQERERLMRKSQENVARNKQPIFITEKRGDTPRLQGYLAMSRSIGDLVPGLEDAIIREPDIFQIAVKDELILVMASDGVWDCWRHNSPVAALVTSRKDFQAEDLVKAAEEHPKASDNISAIIMRLKAV